jgi:hypothetical protein
MRIKGFEKFGEVDVTKWAGLDNYHCPAGCGYSSTELSTLIDHVQDDHVLQPPRERDTGLVDGRGQPLRIREE